MNDTAMQWQDTPAIIPVLANDIDVDGDVLRVTSFTRPAHGKVINNGDGSLTYTPTSGFIGSDSFAYSISDGQGATATGMVTLNVMPLEMLINADNHANDRRPDTFHIVRNGDSLEVQVNDRLVLTTLFAFAPLLKIIGSNDNDTLILDFSGGNPLSPQRINFDGKGKKDSDTILLTGGSVSEVEHTSTSASSGNILVDGSTISYAGLKSITDNLIADDRSFIFGNNSDTINLDTGLKPNDNISRISSAVSNVTVDFKNPDQSLAINLGKGNDTIFVGPLYQIASSGFDVLIEGCSGNDLLMASKADFNVTLIGGKGNDILVSGYGNDILLGGEGNDLLIGGPGDDFLDGGSGNDILLDGSGNDRLYGGNGNDILIGGSGNDYLNGGLGRDIMVDNSNKSKKQDRQILVFDEWLGKLVCSGNPIRIEFNHIQFDLSDCYGKKESWDNDDCDWIIDLK